MKSEFKTKKKWGFAISRTRAQKFPGSRANQFQ